ncbi:hypothetical protein EXIGLDRAFT_828919 [Exidia glandulosa HHB12029]|uniref:Uncharacterized protein n=1 Tax=Exidia glandulosa HHB12029 TaxID=1314781 RepID=A0A165PX20_EXIGL|nr:hypothetical protein EXIGLDRAFT_828919 [Exidia glandulosa HHB12029]
MLSTVLLQKAVAKFSLYSGVALLRTSPALLITMIRVLNLDWSLATAASEDELVRYVQEKSALEASVVVCRLTPDAAHEQFTLDDPCNLLRVNSKLYASWNRGAWAIVPSHLDCVLFWLTEANGKWQDAVATNTQAGRDLRFDDRMKFNALTYNFIVLEEDEFSRPEDFLATTSNHTVAQHYVSREGRLHCVADDVSFEKLHLPLRGDGGHNDVTPFTIVLSAATRFRCMLDRQGALPAHLHALWAQLQATVDALFFKPVGWDDPTARLTDAFVQVSLHGKRRRKPYRDLLAEMEAAEIAINKFHRKARRPPRSVV